LSNRQGQIEIAKKEAQGVTTVYVSLVAQPDIGISY